MLQRRLREGLRQVRAAVGAGGVSTVVEVAPWSRIPGSARTARSARRLNAPRPGARRERTPTATPRRVNRQDVAVVREEWRVVDRWWTDEPVHRRYFDLVLETGENTVVYHDDDAGSWFTQRA